MSEWKGPWKCDRCGIFIDPKDMARYSKGGKHSGWNKRCQGTLLPYDRRAGAPEPATDAGLVEQVEVVIEEYCGNDDFGKGATKTWAVWRNDFARRILAIARFIERERQLLAQEGLRGKLEQIVDKKFAVPIGNDTHQVQLGVAMVKADIKHALGARGEGRG